MTSSHWADGRFVAVPRPFPQQLLGGIVGCCCFVEALLVELHLSKKDVEACTLEDVAWAGQLDRLT